MAPGFTSPPNPADFRAQVWAVTCQIPPGKVATYGQIAALVGTPQGCRNRIIALSALAGWAARWPPVRMAFLGRG